MHLMSSLIIIDVTQLLFLTNNIQYYFEVNTTQTVANNYKY